MAMPIRHALILLFLPGFAAMDATDARAGPAYERVQFTDLPGWSHDDHASALAAFRQACAVPAKGGRKQDREGLAAICKLAVALPASDAAKPKTARAFFERHFQPSRIIHDRPDGLFTGYYEPELPGSLTPDAKHKVPVLKRPEDLVDTVPATERAKANAEGRLAAMRQTAAGLEPYFTREDIEKGALAGRQLELLYLQSSLDAYIMHVQGSGTIRLTDGQRVRIGYAGKNGYPYTSAGMVLIRQGEIKREDLTLKTMRAWFDANPKRSQAVLNENKSYIFFERKPDAEGATGPIGGHGTPLSPRRSVAVDPSFHMLGAPLYVVSETLRDEHGKRFRHLTIAQDVGSAIHGPERADIFWGTGAAAEAIAGRTKDRGHIFALLPRPGTP
jgi:membrane-bound lytic murein transglycosylase A